MIAHDLLLQLVEPAVGCAQHFAARRATLTFADKGRGDFVSQADHAVEAVIRSEMHRLLGDVHILGEEDGGSLDTEGSGWAIDPIDGTTNFLRGLPLWGIAIGYLNRGQPTAGIIALPELGVVLSAVAGNGVLLNGKHFERPGAPQGVKLIALGENDFETGAAVDLRAESFRQCGTRVVRYYCASFSIASAALGWTDGYIERGCSLWDIAAGAAIVREAGMRVHMAEIERDRWAIEVQA